MPVILSGVTGPVIIDIFHQHTKILRIWYEYNNTNNDWKQQLIVIFDDSHIYELRNLHTGYNNVLMTQLLTHLYDMYVIIYPMQIKENYAHMR